jgi:hypothetical protein
MESSDVTYIGVATTSRRDSEILLVLADDKHTRPDIFPQTVSSASNLL